MFFTEERFQFFRPLTGKYRQQVMDCLSGFYNRLYGSLADYSRSFNRDQLIEIFEEVVARSSVFEDETDEFQLAPRSQREQANWILNQLLEYGWLERQMDEATLQSTYAFTRQGRMFTEPMVEAAGRAFRTRHRNTRNTRNALKSFLDKGDVYDLLDAFEYSERIIADFSDVIAELDERKRQLVKDIEAQQIMQRASDEFFDFMENRFMPDLAIRLSADSVEKYRDELSDLIASGRRKRKEFKLAVEKELRRTVPDLVIDKQRSLYLDILEGIDMRMQNASSVMLPALRQALQSFTRRADIIMRQLSYTGGNSQQELQDYCQRLRLSNPSAQARALENAGAALASLRVRFVDTENLRMQTKRQNQAVNPQLEEHQDSSPSTRKALFIQAALDQAFTFNNQRQRDYVFNALSAGRRVHSQHLPVTNAGELLMSAHIIELGARNASEYAFKVSHAGSRVSSEYFNASDEFIIELVERDPTHAE
ncbi:MAG: DUF5716 family protein [Gammaproteobacteria bacterium]|nr:DUF5716 family protein [Gammaproteobacteria bacterium]MDH5730971.1 DUF5716 family protein [Gammaproteobacteria bacterium]